jgi:hypothetical protein
VVAESGGRAGGGAWRRGHSCHAGRRISTSGGGDAQGLRLGLGFFGGGGDDDLRRL